MPRPTRAAAIAAALLITGCAREPDVAANNAVAQNVTGEAIAAEPARATVPSTSPVATGSPTPATDATVSGHGSAITLTPLSADEIRGAALAGELGCSFATGRATLLLAMGNVDSTERTQGVVKLGPYAESVGAPGGFDAMSRGTTFAGWGTTIVVRITGAPIAQGESPARPATMTVKLGDGASRTVTGTWTCGP